MKMISHVKPRKYTRSDDVAFFGFDASNTVDLSLGWKWYPETS
jgi:hypothetical protein